MLTNIMLNKFLFISFFCTISTFSLAENSQRTQEIRSYNQPKVDTQEFVVDQADQRKFQDMKKDTPEIQVESSDALGIKKMFSEYKQLFTEKGKLKGKLKESLDTVRGEN